MERRLRDKLRMKESGLYRRYIISYVCVFLLPILILFAMYYAETTHTVQERLQEANLSTANGLLRELENSIAEFNKLAVYLDADMNQKLLANVSYEALQNADYVRIKAFSEEVSRLASANETRFSKVYVYFGTSGIYVTSNSAQRLEYGFSSLHPELSISKESWLKQIWDEVGMQLHWILEQTETRFEMYAVKRLPLLGTEKTCTLVARMNTKHMFYMLQAILEKGGAVGIYLTDNGTPIYVSSTEMLEVPWSETAQAQKYSVVASKRYGFTVVLSMPDNQWQLDLMHVQRISTATLVLCVVVGAVLTVFFAKRHYDPIHRLANIAGSIGNQGEDEYAKIRYALLKAEEAHRRIDMYSKRETMEKNEKYLRRLFIEQDDATQSDFLTKYMSNLTLRMILFVFPGVQCEDTANNNDEAMYSTLIFEEFAKNSFLVEAPVEIITGCSMILVIVRANTETFRDETARMLCERIISFTRENYTHEAIALIGSAVEGDVNRIVQEMRRAFTYVMDFPVEEDVLVCAQLPDMRTPENDAKYVSGKCRELVAFIQAGEFREAEARLNLLMEHIQTKRTLLLENAVIAGLYHDIVLLALNMKMEKRGRMLAKLERCFQRFEKVNDVERWEMIRQMINAIEDADSKRDKDKGTELVQRVKRIVAREYANQQFCVGRIADELNMPIDTVSRLFKKVTMVGTLEYIHQVRIQNAKILLSEQPELTVQEVALKVGYSNADSFIRAFRRIENITPGRFKQNKKMTEN